MLTELGLRDMIKVVAVLEKYASGVTTLAELIKTLSTMELVILATYDTPEDTTIRIQDYIMHGKLYTPIFSDLPTANQLLTGVSIPAEMKFVGIQGSLLFGLFQQDEWLVIDPGSSHMTQFHASDVRRII